MLEKELILPTNPPTHAEVVYGLGADDDKSQLLIVQGHYPAFGQPIYWPKRQEIPDQTIIYRHLDEREPDNTKWDIIKPQHDKWVDLGRIHTKHIPLAKKQ